MRRDSTRRRNFLQINEAYEASDAKPVYEISDTVIKITLPIIKEHTELSKDENKIFEMLKGKKYSR